MINETSKKTSKKNEQENFYFTILNLLKANKYPSQIAEELNVSKQKINYYIRQMKKEGVVQKKGYGVWETKQVKILTSEDTNKQVKEIRGHAFIWTIKLPKLYDWNSKLGTMAFKLIRNKFPRIMVDNRKIWLGKYSITIYEPHSFYGRNAIESRKYAVINLLEILKELESKLGINLKPYTFKPAREHYGIIKNDLAQQCNKQGEKIHIYDDMEGEWLWVDDSLSLGELETGGSKALTRNVQVQNWWNDNKKHNFEVTPTFLLGSINQVTQNQMIFDKNMSSHLQVLQNLNNAVNELRNEVRNLR